MIRIIFVLVTCHNLAINAEFSNIEPLNMALVRLGGQVYFQKDVKTLELSFKALKCLNDNSYINNFLAVSRGMFEREESSSLSNELKAFISIEKLKLSSISSSSILIADSDLVALSNDCSHVQWNLLSREEKSLFVSEVYLRQRFSNRKELEKSMKEFVKNINIQYPHELFQTKPSTASLKLLREKLSSQKSVLSDEVQEAESDEK